MPDPHPAPLPGAPDLAAVRFGTLWRAVWLGWQDMRAAPFYAVTFSGLYVLAGWLMVWITRATGQSYWLIFAAIGFPLIAPFAAVGFYEVSGRRTRGLPLEHRAIFGVILRQSRRQIPSISAIILVIFLFWFFLAHMIFALFLGLATMTHVSSSFVVLASPQGILMLITGGLVGGGFAALLYMITVLALPMLLDREVDFVTAMIRSFSYVVSHPRVMFGWACGLAVACLLALLPGFLGLFVVLPVLGHATWHLYAALAYGDEAEPS